MPMKVVIISLFVSFICTSEKIVGKTKSVLEDEELENLIKALKTNNMDDKHRQTLKILGKAIESGEILDKDNKHQEEFKLLGKAILAKNLNEEVNNLFGKLLENTEDEESFNRLLDTIKNKQTNLSQQERSQIQGDEPVSVSHNNNGQDAQGLTSVTDNDVALQNLSEVLKSNKFSTDKEKIMDLISKVLGYEKLLNKEHQEIFRLLGKALSFRKFVDNNYPKTLKLLGDAIVSNQISKNRNNELLKFLSDVFITKTPLDDEAYKQLAEMLVKKERSENNVSKPQALTTVVKQEPPHPLSDEAVNETNENQVSHDETPLMKTTPNDSSPNEQDSTTVDQNTSMEITESAEPKKRGKRSSESNVKSNSDSYQSKDKSNESRKKSSKKTKRLRRSTKGSEKPTSKNKNKRSKRKKSKERTEISGHDDVPNSKDTDMMGDDPNTYNENVNSEAPFTKTVDTKPTVADLKTNDKSSTSYKNNTSKLFNSYYPEEYKRFVPLNPAIAYRRPKLLFLNDDNQVVPKLKTVDSDQSKGGNFKKHVIKPHKIAEVPSPSLVLTFTVSRSV